MNFIDNEDTVKNKIRTKSKSVNWQQKPSDKSELFSEDVLINHLCVGPTENQVNRNKFSIRELIIETLKLGDIFPAYFAINNFSLDVDFIAESPVEILTIKLTDLKEIVPVIIF